MRVYDKQESCLICFFEGYDTAYYHSRIDNRVVGEKEYINCGGKQNVLSLFNSITNHELYKFAKTAFFIDRDFDPPICEELRTKVYETPVYSIENFYVTVDAFKRILGNAFRINKNSETETEVEIYKKCVEVYQHSLNLFHDKAALLNFFLMIIREKESLNSIKHSFNLLKFKNLFQVQLNDVTCKYDLRKLNAIFVEAADIQETDIAEKRVSISDAPENIFRGKFEIEFLKFFLKKLKDDLCLIEPVHFSCRNKVSFNISESTDQILNDLSQYADTPECLIEYLSLFER